MPRCTYSLSYRYSLRKPLRSSSARHLSLGIMLNTAQLPEITPYYKLKTLMEKLINTQKSPAGLFEAKSQLLPTTPYRKIFK